MKDLFEIENAEFLRQISYFFTVKEFRAALFVNKYFYRILQVQIPLRRRVYLNLLAGKISLELQEADSEERINILHQIPSDDIKIIDSFISISPSVIITRPLANIRFRSNSNCASQITLISCHAFWIALLAIACLLLTGKLGNPERDYSFLCGIILGVAAVIMGLLIHPTKGELEKIYHTHQVARYYNLLRENTIRIFSEQPSPRTPLLQDAKNNRSNEQERYYYEI